MNEEILKRRLVTIEDDARTLCSAVSIHKERLDQQQRDILSLGETISFLRLRIAELVKKHEEEDF